jgi:crotonobetainyl-CoA:carnitine CoA-transferase CaiB-like acyl-CoA transferase
VIHDSAEVIKVEACRKMDGYRGGPAPDAGSRYYPNGEPGERPWHRHAYFNTLNRNKLGITLDLTTPEGVDIVKQLVAVSDVLVENYSSRVMRQLGLHFEILNAINPRLIMCSMPGFGLTGPHKDYVAYGTTIEAMSGLASLLGYEDGPPMHSGMAYGDPVAGITAADAVLTALLHRDRTGTGQHVEVAQVEAASCLIGEAFMDYFMNKRLPSRQGNRHRSAAPHGCYPTAGDDQWVAIAVCSDAEWQRFCKAIGQPALADDSRFADALSRWKNQAELDEIVAAWTCQHDHYAVMRILQAAGVAAGPVLSADELLADPQLVARGFFVEMEQPEVGRHPYPTLPARSSVFPTPLVRRPAPRLGEHNRLVLQELLGLPEERIAKLEQDGVIGTEPIT